MEPITLRLEEDTVESLDEEAEEHGLNRSEYIRQVIDRRDEYGEIERLRGEKERVEYELRKVLEQREEATELAKYVEEEQEWRSAPIWKRAKWWVVGKD